MANPTSLEGLPAEILNHILDLLPKDALVNLRLTSVHHQLRAKEYLYRHLNLYDSGGSAARVKEITQEESLASLVRDVALHANEYRPIRVL